MTNQQATAINYTTVMAVEMSWQKLKTVPDYEERVGEVIFQRCVRIQRQQIDFVSGTSLVETFPLTDNPPFSEYIERNE